MKNTKRQFKMFSFFDFDGITAYMEKMAADGWMLDQTTNRYWIYRRTEPKKVKFAVTYFPRASDLTHILQKNYGLSTNSAKLQAGNLPPLWQW